MGCFTAIVELLGALATWRLWHVPNSWLFRLTITAMALVIAWEWLAKIVVARAIKRYGGVRVEDAIYSAEMRADLFVKTIVVGHGLAMIALGILAIIGIVASFWL
jgi:hypothetical protein